MFNDFLTLYKIFIKMSPGSTFYDLWFLRFSHSLEYFERLKLTVALGSSNLIFNVALFFRHCSGDAWWFKNRLKRNARFFNTELVFFDSIT